MLISGLSTPVFPLKNIDVYMSGYYMDREGGVWSTRRRHSAYPVKLAGSLTPSGRYYTLNGRTHRADDVFRRASQHKDFMTHTGGAAGALPAQLAKSDLQGRTASATEAVSKKGYLLATLTPTGKLVFGTTPMFHTSDVTAKAEAERVAGLTGTEIVMLKIVGKVKVQKAVWE